MMDARARLSTALADRYKIERHLGASGMATVYLAEDTRKPYVKAGAIVEAAGDWPVEQANGKEGGGSG